MSGSFASLPQFPEEGREKLTPPRRGLGRLLGLACALAAVAGGLIVLRWLSPLLVFMVAFWPLGLICLVIYVLAPVALLSYTVYESNRRMR
jgi:hypothetical protein